MSDLQDLIRTEIEDLHDFFVEWFTGQADKDDLEIRCLSHLHADFLFIPPEGTLLKRTDLEAGFRQAHGSNRNFRIKVRDVVVRHEMPDHVLVTYTEWQTGATASGSAENARLSTALLTKGRPFQCVHLQETRLPDEAHASGRQAGYFDIHTKGAEE